MSTELPTPSIRIDAFGDILPTDGRRFVMGDFYSADQMRAALASPSAAPAGEPASQGVHQTERLAADGAAVGVMRWIPVSERLPEPDTEVLVYGKSPWAKEPYARIDTWAMQREAPLSFSSATIETGYMWDESDFDDISHWMPLPPAPVAAMQEKP